MTTTSVPDPSPAPAQVSSSEQARTPRRPLHCPPATHHTRTGTHDYTVTSLADGRRRVTGTYTGGPVPIEIWVEFDLGCPMIPGHEYWVFQAASWGLLWRSRISCGVLYPNPECSLRRL